jgi:hypothetical protein
MGISMGLDMHFIPCNNGATKPKVAPRHAARFQARTGGEATRTSFRCTGKGGPAEAGIREDRALLRAWYRCRAALFCAPQHTKPKEATQ